MLPLTKSQIFVRVAASVNGDATSPNTTDTEYGVWSEFLEEANQEWPLAFDFRANTVTYRTTAPVSGTSVGLPSGTIKLLGFPEFDGQQYAEVHPEDTALYDPPYVVKAGNDRDGFYLTTTPLRSTGGTFVAASIRLLQTPTSLSTTTSISPIPDANFLVKRLTAKVLKQRGDAAYSLYDDEADAILARMIEQEVVQFPQLNQDIKSTYSRSGFTVGED